MRGGFADVWAALRRVPGQTAARALDALRDGAGYGAYLEQKHMDPGKLPTMSEEEQLRLLATDGMLVKRPILVTDDKVLVGFRQTEWEQAGL